MTDTISTGQLSTAERNKMAAINGLILGLIYIVICTAVNQLGTQLVFFSIAKFVGYVIYLLVLGVMLTRIRKANGGYIELREAFGAAFVTVLIAGTLSYAYQFLYIYVIDPGFTDRVMNASIATMEKAGAPDEQIDAMMEKIDKSKKINVSDTILGFLGGVLLDSLFGLIVSLIVKKPRPIFEPM